MKIFPAIDCWNGRVIRLAQGDFQNQTVYHEDPIQIAQQFWEMGAEYLHVVDLEGARQGYPVQIGLIQRLLNCSPLKVQIGGGLRSLEAAEDYLQAGAFRVVLGTAALRNRKLLETLLLRYGERITVGLDVRENKVAIEGWTSFSEESPSVWLQRFQELGVQSILCSDIQKDGLLQGANQSLYRDLSQQYPGRIIASGGIHNEEDVKSLLTFPLDGMVIGKALYSGHLDLKRVLQLKKEAVV